MSVPENGPVDGTAQSGEAPTGAPAPPAEAVEAPSAEAVALAALQAELESTKAQLEASSGRLRAVSKAYTELQSEMKAFRERMEHRAKQDSELQAFEQVRRFFDPVMNLKRSLGLGSSGNPADDLAAMRQGLTMVQTQFMDALSGLGLAEVPGVGSTFDPQVHEALGVQPVTERGLDGKVLVVHTSGFSVNGRVLQAAQVVIGKYEESAGEA